MAFAIAWVDGAWVDSAWAIGSWVLDATGIVAINEEGDVIAGVGVVSALPEGVVVIVEQNDTTVITGTSEIKFDIDIRSLNLTIPRADDDIQEQQRILIENANLIQQALRNLGQ